MLLETVVRAAAVIGQNQDLFDSLRMALDVFMMPALLPLLDCSDSSLASVENQNLALVASAILIYLVMVILWLLSYCCFAFSLKSCMLAVNHVVLPWLLVWLLVFCEGCALWARRHDFLLLSFRRDFGLVSAGVYRSCLLWPVWELAYLLLMAAIGSALQRFGVARVGSQLAATCRL
eukprot:Skav225763  [mRNA]  locus=scaffold3552:187389:194244:- [translate_table: standard]